jgi:two-component system, cell cycle sensor histidine kinase and response regulator CckA
VVVPLTAHLPDSARAAAPADPIAVLLVDDDEQYAAFVRQVFAEMPAVGVTIDHVRRLSDVLRRLHESPASVVLLDVNLPDGNGLEWLLDNRARLHAAVIVLTGNPDCELQGHIGALAQDFLIKFQIQPEHLVRAVRYAADRERAWQQLNQSREYFQSLIEQARDLITVVDDHGRIVYQSPASGTVLGYAPSNMVRRHLADLVTEDNRPPLVALLDRLFDGSVETARGEFQVRHADGSVRVLDMVASRIRAGDGDRRAVVNARDVTERRQAEETLRSRDEQLRQVMKIEAIGRLAGGIAHDFSNVLTVITGACERLQDAIDAGGLASRAGEDVETILSNCGRAASMTRQLLAFSRQQTLSPQPIDLGRLVGDSGRMLGPLIGEHIELRTHVEPDVDPVEADPVQMEQVLLNLAINARDAMPGGGILTLRVANTVVTDRFALSHPPILPGRYVLLEVRDTGCGMTESTRARAFEPFFTTKGLDGTGLGLSTVYGIVKQSGGYIWITSAPGAGTTFTIHMPPTARVPVTRPAARSAASRAASRATILLTEDDPDVRQMLSMLLDAAGHTVLAADTPDAAIARAEAHDGPIDLLLTDVVMPGGTGRDLARRMHTVRPGLRVLYISGYPEYGAASSSTHVLEPGVAFLAKPFTRDVLIRRIDEMLEQNGSEF